MNIRLSFAARAALLFVVCVTTIFLIASENASGRYAQLFSTIIQQNNQAGVAYAIESQSRLLFVGDLMLARVVEQVIDNSEPDYIHTGMRSLYETHGYQIANFESTIPKSHTPTRPYTYQFSTRAEHAYQTIAAGFTHLSLANNHSKDFGIAEYHNTVEFIELNGATAFGMNYQVGSSSVTVINAGLERVALIGIDLTLSDVSEGDVAEIFATARNQSDQQIVYVHWGTEYAAVHNTRQERYATLFVKYGADLIIGHHPHVVQDVGLIQNVPVFYSLGNYIFDQYFSTEVQLGLVLSVDAIARTVTILPVSTIETPMSPRVLEPEASRVFLSQIAARSDGQLTSSIEEGTVRY
ncbi:CapA family protein [Candidatus Pacebacteria bacterium]|nr:CapA family protein [Candidatus Paceibacterota bacterium]